MSTQNDEFDHYYSGAVPHFLIALTRSWKSRFCSIVIPWSHSWTTSVRSYSRIRHILGLDMCDLLVERSPQFPMVSRKCNHNNSVNYLLNFVHFFKVFRIFGVTTLSIDTEMAKRYFWSHSIYYA